MVILLGRPFVGCSRSSESRRANNHFVGCFLHLEMLGCYSGALARWHCHDTGPRGIPATQIHYSTGNHQVQSAADGCIACLRANERGSACPRLSRIDREAQFKGGPDRYLVWSAAGRLSLQPGSSVACCCSRRGAAHEAAQSHVTAAALHCGFASGLAQLLDETR